MDSNELLIGKTDRHQYKLLVICFLIHSMDTKDNIVHNNILNDCINVDNECVVFIATDTYWLDELETEETPEELTAEYGDLRYSLIIEGNLGEYYFITM